MSKWNLKFAQICVKYYKQLSHLLCLQFIMFDPWRQLSTFIGFITGWSHHPVSNKRYHFIIPAPEQTDRSKRANGVLAGAKICFNCKEPLLAGFLSCPLCSEEALTSKFLDSQSHLLHGVIHCNGYGHLLRINGREKGSNFASGREIMDLWDRMCAMLRAR